MLVIVNDKNSKFVSEICKDFPLAGSVMSLTENYALDREMIYVIDIPATYMGGKYTAFEASDFIRTLMETFNNIKSNLNNDSNFTFVVNNVNSNAFAKSCYLLITEFLESISFSTSTSLITSDIETMPFPNFSKMRLGTDSVFSETNLSKIRKISNLLSRDNIKDNFGILNMINIK